MDSNIENTVFIHPSAYIDEGCSIGQGCKIWHFAHIMSESRVGKNCIIGQNVFVGKNVIVGNNCKIQNNVSLYSGVTLADNVFLGPSCVFTNVLTPRADIERKEEFKATLVEYGATVGANVTILCGNTIHEYALIGAGSVVTTDVPAFALMIGNPARRHGWVSRRGCTLRFNKEGFAVCPESQERYQLNEGNVIPLTNRHVVNK